MNKFLKGAAILGAAGIIVKIIGVAFRIPLTLWVGADGLSYYSSVYQIYTFLLILSTAGFPVAISRMVSERIALKNYGGAHKVFTTAVWLMTAIGVVFFGLVFFGAGFIEKTVLDCEGTFPSIRAIAPALLLVPIMSAFRGYFQGRQNMNPTALSQLVEQLFRVGFGLLLAYMFIGKGNEYVSAGATLGCSVGSLAGLAIMLLVYGLSRNYINKQINHYKDFESKEDTKYIVKRILAIAIPITIGASVLPLVNAIDAAMVMRRLQATGWSFVESKALWGRLGGYCDSLIGLPQAFISAIAMSLVPAISASHKLGDKIEEAENMKLAMRVAMLIGLPCAAGIFSLAHPILKLLYPTAKVAQEVSDAAPTLQLMCLIVAFMSIIQTMTGALQGIGKQGRPVRNIAIGAIFKIVLTYVLVGIRSINVNGACIATIVCYIVAALLDIRDVRKFAGVKFDPVLTYIKPLISSVAMGACAFGMYKLVFAIIKSNAVATLVAIAFGVIVYVALILITKSITLDEIRRLPKGNKLANLLEKVVK